MSLLEAQVPSHSLSNDLLEEAPKRSMGVLFWVMVSNIFYFHLEPWENDPI